jgi:hypothetical protein
MPTKRKTQRRSVLRSGSQTSEPIELTEYNIVQRDDIYALLRNSKTGKKEVWVHNQNFAGYCIRIGRKNYEFVRSL